VLIEKAKINVFKPSTMNSARAEEGEEGLLNKEYGTEQQQIAIHDEILEKHFHLQFSKFKSIDYGLI
jgi:hypothetical protein